MFMRLKFVVVIGWLLILAACLIAWRFGGKAERRAALLFLATSFLTGFPSLIPDHEIKRFAYLAIDGVLAGGLLLLGVRYARTWLGVAVFLQGVQFSLHAYYIVASRGYDNLFSLMNNLVSLGVLVSLVAGSLLTNRTTTGQAAAK